MFRFKADTDEKKIAELIRGYESLPKKIEHMKQFEWGADMSVENLHEGFTHCFITTFADVAGRDAYIPHEAHHAYVEQLLPYLEKILVVDFHPNERVSSRT